ncbi:ATP-binding cassette domain-containing protein, partial [Escherichia coli]
SKQKCDLVELAVKGLRLNDEIHRVSAFGIIDNDNKVQAKVDNLKKDFIFSLDVHSIESIYYHPRMIKSVIDSVKEANGIDNVAALF